MILYFSLKNKHGYSLLNREQIIRSISDKIRIMTDKYNHIFIPESSSDFLYKVILNLNKPYTVVAKNSKDHIQSTINGFNLQKNERLSHLREIDCMESSFKINELKANHRKHYIPHLFKNYKTIPNSIIIDDSNFSGCTRQALIYSTGTSNYIAIFSKENV